MGIPELIITAIALSMDAFAVAICKGLAMKKVSFKQMAIIGLWFGGFQALMPLIGYFVGIGFKSLMLETGGFFEKYISIITSTIAFILLVIIGVMMIKESFEKEENESDCSVCFKVMIVLAIATSIDALAVGVSYGLLPNVNIFVAITSIGIITLSLSMLGTKIGSIFGAKHKSKAELAGGIVLIAIGLKILVEGILASFA